MKDNRPRGAPNAEVGTFNEGEHVILGLQMLMWDPFMKENTPPGAPNAYVGPFNEGSQGTEGPECLCGTL